MEGINPAGSLVFGRLDQLASVANEYKKIKHFRSMFENDIKLY